MERNSEHRLTLLADLRDAVREQQFSLNYQPQFDLASGRLSGFEALLRWRHPQRGMVPPAEFIPLAEDCGLIVPIGRWVLEHACREAARWPESLAIAVNISAVEFTHTDLRQVVAEVLQSSGLAARRLELELTESTLLNDSQTARALLEDLRGMGVRVALDDFGTGYSSLAYLQNFPLDTLKIDRTFVMVLDDERQSARALAIIESVQGLARALGLRTMAEGIESERQRALLTRIGIDEAQGYLFAPPLDLEHTRERIRQAASAGLRTAAAGGWPSHQTGLAPVQAPAHT
jgi:EAL domain-containing protein (putative c-di-GMP-specific phosphodiesterase class I)